MILTYNAIIAFQLTPQTYPTQMTITQVSHQHTHTAHSQRKHAYRDTFGDAHIQYHEFDNKDLLTVKDKYTALLQQELQNPYWNLHDPIMTKSYQISKDMDIETMPHTMYFTGNSDTVTKINQIPYQTIQYNENSMFTAIDE